MQVSHEKSQGSVRRSVAIEDGPEIRTEGHGILPAFHVKVTLLRVFFDLEHDDHGLPVWRAEDVVYAEGLIFETDGTLSGRHWSGWIPQSDWSRSITSWAHPGDFPHRKKDEILFVSDGKDRP